MQLNWYIRSENNFVEQLQEIITDCQKTWFKLKNFKDGFNKFKYTKSKTTSLKGNFGKKN